MVQKVKRRKKKERKKKRRKKKERKKRRKKKERKKRRKKKERKKKARKKKARKKKERKKKERKKKERKKKARKKKARKKRKKRNQMASLASREKRAGGASLAVLNSEVSRRYRRQFFMWTLQRVATRRNASSHGLVRRKEEELCLAPRGRVACAHLPCRALGSRASCRLVPSRVVSCRLVSSRVVSCRLV